MRFFIILFALLHAPLTAHAVDRNSAERQFQNWIKTDLRQAARVAGIGNSVFTRTFTGMKPNWKLPDLRPPGTKAPKKQRQSQAEFRAPSAYFKEARLTSLTKTGQQLSRKWDAALTRIEARYGVPRHILLAIWAIESGYGRAKIPYSALQVLATNAFMSARKDFYQRELIAALKIIATGRASSRMMKSSWSGALGQPQFMPTSYLEYAVDFDSNGKTDIWTSVPDTLASIAHYLSQKGWQKGRDWGFEVRIPNSVSCAQEGPDKAKSIRAWQQDGINRITGRPFPAHESAQKGMMLVPAGRNGPHFIVTPNFYVIKSYNNSDLYALFVGNLGDRIAYNSPAFRSPWQPQAKMLRSDIATMQRKLEKQGYDVGGADGLPGFKTRRSLGTWQEKNGQKSTCFPTPRLIKAVR